MDILAARKKAAERAKARNNPEPPRPPDVQPVQGGEPSLTAETRPEGDAAAAVPASEPERVAPPEREEAADAPETTPDGEPEITPAPEIELLSFRLGDEEYAVLVEDVREVLKVFQITPVPNAPDYVLGVMSLRGAVTPVIDLCKRLGLTTGVRDEKSRIIVAITDDERVGLMVDRVKGVIRISADAVKPPPENIEKGAEFLRGIVRKDDTLYILLDLDKAVGS